MTEPRVLDDHSTVERLDSQGMLARMEALPEQCEEGWARARSFALPEGHRRVRDLVVLGMGGSAIAGDMLRAISLRSGRKVVQVVRGHDLPPFAGPDTLVVACSHSGNTEETLSAFTQALATDAKLTVITSGGVLAEMAAERGVPAFVYEFEGEPRSALGHQLMAMLSVGEQAAAIDPQERAVAEAVTVLRRQRENIAFAVSASRNAAKALATLLHGRLPVIIGAGALSEAAHRWKTQFNENSKSWALQEELPEAGHNSIVGFALPADVVPQLRVVFLWHASLGARLSLAYQATAEALSDAGVGYERIGVPGEGLLDVLLSAVHFGDFVSYYLALLNEVEPSLTAPILRFKARLEKG